MKVAVKGNIQKKSRQVLGEFIKKLLTLYWQRSGWQMASACNTQQSMAVCNEQNGHDITPMLKLKKVVVLGKMTRLEFERHRYPNCTEKEFKEKLETRGSNYDQLLKQHERHRQTMESILDVLRQRDIECKSCVRGNGYTEEMVNWADAIITAGGDGTFLSAASKVTNQSKPVIGINTVPERSEGHLCLPPYYSSNFGVALDKIANGEFRWLWRQRIRITMSGLRENFHPINNAELIRIRMQRMNNPQDAQAQQEHHLYNALHYERDLHNIQQKSSVLPVLALNEVFIGETLASVPSYYEIQIDGDESEKQKSSGVCIATGTGSTAWSYNISRLHSGAIQNILDITKNNIIRENHGNNGTSILNENIKDDVIKKVTEEFANSHIYGPTENTMFFSVRDPMENRVFSCKRYNGFAKEIVVRSRCWDASLCVDGDTSFTFNDGASAMLSMHPEDALRCVILNEDEANNNINKAKM